MRSLIMLLFAVVLTACSRPSQPSQTDVEACARQKLSHLKEATVTTIIRCDDYIDVVSGRIVDYSVQDSSARVIAEVKLKAKKVFSPSSMTANLCGVREWSNKYYEIGDDVLSKMELHFKYLASDWKCTD
jgi:hypothetical protein